jgi:hypothetical protein
MKQIIEPNDVYAITALTIDSRPNDVVALISKHGVMLPNNPSTKQIETAFGSLLTKSESFRKHFGELATEVVSGNYSNAYGDDLPPSKGIGTTSTSNVTLANIPSNITSTSKPITYDAKQPFSQTGLGKFLSSVFTPETIQNGISTGLNIWSIKQTGQPASNVGSDIGTGRDQLNDAPPTKGTSTTTLVLIGVGALALIGVAVYFYKKK